MSFIDSIKSNLFDLLPHFRNIPLEDLRDSAITVMTGMQMPTEPTRSYANAADEGYRKNELAFACIQEIMTSASEAPLISGFRNDDGFLEQAPGRAAELTANPNTSQDMISFLETFHIQRLIGGNVYMFTPRSAIGTVSGMWLLRPDRMKVIPDSLTGMAKGYKYSINGQEITLPPEVIDHHVIADPLNDWYGLGPLQVLAKQVNLDNSATDFARAVFENKGIPAGFLKLKARLSNQEQADEIRRNWHARFAGKANWQRIGVLDEDADYKELAPSMKDMGLKELRNLTESRICMAFGVPPIVVGAAIGLDKATYANYATAKESLWEETLLPTYNKIASFMTTALKDTPDFRGMEWGFDFTGVRALADDQKQVAEVMKIRADTAGVYIRAGYEPDSVTDALGLPDGLMHTGLVPTTVQGEQLAEGLQPVRALAAPATRGVKDLERAVDREYDSALRLLEITIQRSFDKLGRDADSILGTIIAEQEAAADPATVKAMPNFGISGETLVPVAYDATLAAVILPELRDVAERTWADISATNVLAEISFTSHEGAVNIRLVEASKRATQMNDFTRQRINTALQTGVDRGYSLRSIADGVKKDNFNGLRNIVRGIPTNPDQLKRARVIARTEIRWAQNQTTALRYRAAGVSEVVIRDGDEDDECAAVDGTTQTIEWYESNPLQHPNCTRGATPVTKGLLV